MTRYFWFLFWILMGLGIFAISSISDSLVCTAGNGNCIMQSYISLGNLKLSEDEFSISDIKSVTCEKRVQPSKSGKKIFFVLKLLKSNNTEYTLGSYKKLQICKEELKPIKDLINGKTSSITFKSGIGFTNGIGYIFGILMFFIGIIVLTNKEEYIEEPSSDEDDET